MLLVQVRTTAAPGFAPMLLVQVRTTAAPAAQASVSFAVRIVLVPVTAVSPPPLTTLAVPAQVEVQAVLASAAQIAWLAVSLMVPRAAMLFWVVKENTMLPGVASVAAVAGAALVQVALPLLMVYPVWPVLGAVSVLVSMLKVTSPAAPRSARLSEHSMVASAPAPRVLLADIVTVRMSKVLPADAVTAAVQVWAVPEWHVQAVLAAADQIFWLEVIFTVPEAGTVVAGVNLNSMLPARALGAPVASEVPLRRPLVQDVISPALAHATRVRRTKAFIIFVCD